MMAPERICSEARKAAKPDAGTSGKPDEDDGRQIRLALSGCRARDVRGICYRWPGIAICPTSGGSPLRASNASGIFARNWG